MNGVLFFSQFHKQAHCPQSLAQRTLRIIQCQESSDSPYLPKILPQIHPKMQKAHKITLMGFIADRTGTNPSPTLLGMTGWHSLPLNSKKFTPIHPKMQKTPRTLRLGALLRTGRDSNPRPPP